MFRNILKNLSLYSAGPAITGIVTFLLLPIISNYLPPTGQGILGILETIQRYFFIFATLQIHVGIVRMYLDLKSEKEEKRYAGSIFLFLLVLNIVATIGTGLVFFVFADSIFSSEEIAFSPYIIMKLVICFLTTLPALPRGVFYAKQEALKLFLIKLVILVVDISLTLLLLIVYDMGVRAILWANIASATAAVPLFLYYTVKYSTFCWDWKYIKATLIFCLPFVPAALATATYEHADRYLIQEYLALSDVGIYTFAQKFLLPLSVIGFAVDKAFMPVFITQKNNNDDPGKIKTVVNQLSIFMGLATLGLVYFATELESVVNVKYAPSFSLISYIAIFWFLRMIYMFPGAVLIYYKKSKYFLLINIIPAIFNIGLNVILIPVWGIGGAIVSTISCGVITLIMTQIFAYRLEKKAFDHAKVYVFIMIVSFLCIVNNYLSDQIVLSILSKVALLIVFLLISCRLFDISFVSMIRSSDDS